MKKSTHLIAFIVLFSSAACGLVAKADTTTSTSESTSVSSTTMTSQTSTSVSNLSNSSETTAHSTTNQISKGSTATTTTATPNTQIIPTETVDDWMPDKVLQQEVAYRLGLENVNLITKLAMENSVNPLFLQVGLRFTENYFVKNLTGIEYYKAGYNITMVANNGVVTQDITDLLNNHWENLLGINWYGQIGLGTIDLYEAFKDMENIDTNSLQHSVSMPGEFNFGYDKVLKISETMYKSGGELSISLNEIGLWTSLDKKLFTTNNLFKNLPDLVFQIDNSTKVVYNFKTFDVSTQTLIFEFDSTNSNAFSDIKGKKISHDRDELINVTLPIQDLPNIRLSGYYNGYDNNKESIGGFSDLLSYQFHINIAFPNVDFVSAGAPITVNYIEEGNTTPLDTAVLNGNEGDTYTTELRNFTGYTLKEIQGSLSGTFSDVAQTVTYVYTKNVKVSAPITVKFVDENGNEIAGESSLIGDIGTAYNIPKQLINGYSFKRSDANLSGLFSETPQTITLTYTKNTINTINTGKVIVYYIDENGNSIADSVTLTGNEGDSYVSNKVTIEGYSLKRINGNQSGKYTEKDQTVTYIYTKDSTKNSVDKSSGNNKNTASSSKTVTDKATTPSNASEKLPKTGTGSSLNSIIIGIVIIVLTGILIGFKKKRA